MPKIMMDPPPRERRALQVAALPWRMNGDRVEVLLITSRTNRRWMLPKGWLIQGKTECQAAAQEAFEEAGIRGDIAKLPLGSYRYIKEYADRQNIPAQALVFPMRVTEILDAWPEKHQRDREWMPLREAARIVEVLDLKRLLLDLAHSWRPAATKQP